MMTPLQCMYPRHYKMIKFQVTNSMAANAKCNETTTQQHPDNKRSLHSTLCSNKLYVNLQKQEAIILK